MCSCFAGGKPGGGDSSARGGQQGVSPACRGDSGILKASTCISTRAVAVVCALVSLSVVGFVVVALSTADVVPWVVLLQVDTPANRI